MLLLRQKCFQSAVKSPVRISRVVSKVNPPYVTVAKPGCGDSICYQGIFADVWLELQRRLNFTFIVQNPPDGEFGTRQKNGSWTGMIGEGVQGGLRRLPMSFSISKENHKALSVTLQHGIRSKKKLIVVVTVRYCDDYVGTLGRK